MSNHKIRILIIQANPPGTAHLGADLEERKLQEALRRGQERDLFAPPVRLPAARIGDLLGELRAHQPQILHFMGHGDGQGGLLLNAPDDKQGAILAAAELAGILAAYQAEAAAPLQLVVLAGCHTAGAATLLAKDIPCSLGVTDDIDDQAVSDAFTPAFYAALSDGRSLANALASAQSVMNALGFSAYSDLLTLYSATTDPIATRPRDWLQPAPPTATSQQPAASLPYLRHWFGQPWSTVSLADIQSDREDQAQLLDLYVPLPVDFRLVIQTEEGRIVDWWAFDKASSDLSRTLSRAVAGGEEDEERNQVFVKNLVSAGAPTKPRHWADLRVGEAELASLIPVIQQGLDERKQAERTIRDEEYPWPLEAHHAAMLQPRFVLLGDPGSGKSSFLRHLTLCLAGELRQRMGDHGVPANANLAALGNWILDAYTPLYIEMRTLVSTVFPTLPADTRQPTPLPTVQTLWDYLAQEPALARFSDDLYALINDGKVMLLLDGLDEIPQADDPRRRAQVKAFVNSLVQSHADLRIIVGSRPHAYHAGEWALAGFGHTTLRPLSLARLEELARALFAVVGPTSDRHLADAGHFAAKQAATTFVQALRDHPHLDERFHANPLFFTLLAALWLGNPQRRLPETQAELYRAAVDLLLDRWTRRRAPNPSVAEQLGLTPAELRPVLETLACTVHEQDNVTAGGSPGRDSTIFPVETLLGILFRGNYRVVPQDISDYLTQQVGLLVSPAPARFYFSHRSFQEHLAACELTCRQPDDRRPPLRDDRRYPAGLIRRVQSAPALWENVAFLAADELMTQGREGQTLLWELLDEFCQPYMTAGDADHAAIIALRIAHRHDLFAMNKSDRRYRRDLEPLRQVALQVLTDTNHFTPEERNVAGELLGRHPDHDTRKGVGRRRDGLPDIDWVKIPEADAQGRREFIYQKDERRTEPTFWIARYPVTYSQFQAFLDAQDGFYNPAWWEGLAVPAEERAAPGEQRFKFWNHPRERVSWYDAVAFCRWLTAQAQAQPVLLPPELRGKSNWRITLPTEWQWEKAMRGHDGRQYPWGDSYQSGYANINETYQNAGPSYLEKSSAVGMYPLGISPTGLLDASGNVWEWCLNEYHNPVRIQEAGDALRVVRGGSWDYGAHDAALAYRDIFLYLRFHYRGFRLVVL
ncbi:MAG: SUMF1/EgtB/PvdO family nonheme iron enzyme [Caldilineaceae bacterium]